MACFAGLFTSGGAAVDPALLERMAEQLQSRAPDGVTRFIDGRVGMVIAALHGAFAAPASSQPLRRPGEFSLVADARLDGREALVSALRARGGSATIENSDAELIASAYTIWGERCVEHLIGDFAFVLWDEVRTVLWMVRDQLGVRPLYYARSAAGIAFSTAVEALLELPGVDTSLDEVAVADFLLWGIYIDPERTIYNGVRCVPPAHVASTTAEGVASRRYWSIPRAEFAGGGTGTWSESVESFRRLLADAVASRLPRGALALELSGGMDSTSIAATARSLAPAGSRRMVAYCTTSEGLFPDDPERRLASQVAEHLGLEFECGDLTLGTTFERSTSVGQAAPEPVSAPHTRFFVERSQHALSAGAGVFLTGQGGDEVLGPGYTLRHLIRRAPLGQSIRRVAAHLHRARSWRGLGLRDALLRSRAADRPMLELPRWLDPRFIERLGLADRWSATWRMMRADHGLRHHLEQPWLSRIFETYERPRVPVRFRHPFFDLRLIAWMLQCPDPWKLDKRLLREAMRGALPESVLARPKAGIAGDTVFALLARDKSGLAARAAVERISAYVDPRVFRQILEDLDPAHPPATSWATTHLAATLALAIWYADRHHTARLGRELPA
jgi:asparagine synthase (glutamine-hydrolysing)